MAGATLTTFSDILKEDYKAPLQNQLNSKTILYNRLQKSEEITQGLEAYVPLVTGRNHSLVARATTGALLPTHGQQEYQRAVYPMRFLLGRLKVELPVMVASRNDIGAFTKVVEAEMRGLVRDAVHDLNRQMLGRGDGELTVCGTTSNSTTVTVVTTNLLEVGSVIDIRTASTGAAVANGAKITVLTVPSSTTFTVSIAVTTASTESVYVEGSRNVDIFGIDYIVDNVNGSNGLAKLGGVDRDTVPLWKANVVTNPSSPGTNIALSNQRMQQAIDDADINGGSAGDGISAIITNHAISRVYGNNTQADLRWPQPSGESKETLGFGYTGLTYSGIPILHDKHAKSNVMYFLDESSITIYHEGDWDWMDQDGAVLSRVLDEAAYEATLFRLINLGPDACNTHTRLEDIQES